MAYTLKFLSSKEFDRLPYRDASISLGLADPRMNTAYVRHSHLSELNKYLLDHEFDHLVETVPTDEEDGVRYKKGRQVIGNIAAVAGPIIGGMIGGPPGAAVGGAIGGGLKGGIGGQEKSLKGAGIGAGVGAGTGYFGSKLTGNFGIPEGGPRGFGGLTSNLGTSLKSGLGVGNILPNLGSFFGFGGGGGGGAATSAAFQAAPKFGGNLLPQMAPLSRGTGQLLAPPVPFSQSASKIATGIGTGGGLKKRWRYSWSSRTGFRPEYWD